MTDRLLEILSEHAEDNPIHADDLILRLGIGTSLDLQEPYTRLSRMAELRRTVIQPARKTYPNCIGSGHGGYWFNGTEAQRRMWRDRVIARAARTINSARRRPDNPMQEALI